MATIADLERLFSRQLPTPFPAAVAEPPAVERALVTRAPFRPEVDVATLRRIPASIRTRPWRHQVMAYDFLMGQMERGGALGALDMGTGKTLIALMCAGAMWESLPEGGPSCERHHFRVLIACPLRVVPVWPDQIGMHWSGPYSALALDDEWRSVEAKREAAERGMEIAAAQRRPFFCVINYDSIWRDPFAQWAQKQRWDLVIADESHRIKAPTGRASKYLAMFARPREGAMPRRLGLTGTPLPHSPLDIWAQFRFLSPGIFGPSFTAFRNEYSVMGGFNRKQVVGFRHLERLQDRMSWITYTVRKEDVLDLPEEIFETYHCALANEGARVYAQLEKDMIAQIAEGTVTAANAMVKLLRLQQIVGGWLKPDEGDAVRIDHAKEKLLQDLLEDMNTDEPVVVFCRFRGDLDAVHAACAELKRKSMELSGRRDDLKAWQEGEGIVLAVQIQAGGSGVDLTRARYSIFYSLTFSLGEYDQALSRVHRPGQTRPVQHFHLVAKGTVDEKIKRALEKRADVVESILKELRG